MSVTWDEAVRSFLINQKANLAAKTVTQRRTCMTQLARWCEEQGVTVDAFGKRHLDEYIAMRRDMGLKPKTVYHDAVSAKVFTKYCKLYDLIDRDPLAGYTVKNPPNPAMYFPTEDDMATLLKVAHDYWDITKRKDADRASANRRGFHRDRNYAILMMYLDTAARANEVLSVKLDDYFPADRRVSLTTKGSKTLTLTLHQEVVDAVTVWETRRRKLMRNIPEAEREDWLFVTESGGKIEPIVFRQALHKMTAWAGLTDKISIHSLRRYSGNKTGLVDINAASKQLGHSNVKTTEIYTNVNADRMRDAHDKADVIGSLLNSKRAEKRKRAVG